MSASIEKARARVRRYKSSLKGIATRKRYQTSSRGRELDRKRAARYRALNPELVRLRNARYGQTEKGKATGRRAQARYAKTPYGRVAKRIRKDKQRSLKRVSRTEILLITEWEKLWRTKAIVRCFWCRSKIRSKNAHSDHIIPLAKGGIHGVDNLCISCAPCNLSKNAKELRRWNRELTEPILL